MLPIAGRANPLTNVVAARTGWSIKKFVRTARRCHTVDISVGKHTVIAGVPRPADFLDLLARINRSTVEM